MQLGTRTLVIHPGSPLLASGNVDVDLGYRIEEQGKIVNGVYCRWTYCDGDLQLENDHFGMFPVFYSTWGGGLVLSTDIREVLKTGVPADVDYDALSVFLRMGFHIGCNTPFRHIRRLPPCARASRTGESWRIDSPETIAPPPYAASRDAAIEDYIDLFRGSMRRLLGVLPAFQLPLSGGRDSRHILLEALHQGHKPALAVTTEILPHKCDNATEIAARLLAGTKIPHEVVSPDTNLHAAARAHNRLTHFMSAEHVWTLALRDRLVAYGLPVLDGLAGDVMSAPAFQHEELMALANTGCMTDLADRFLFKLQSSLGLSDETIKSTLNDDIARELSRDRAIAHVADEMCRHQGMPDPLRSFIFHSRTRNGPGLFSLGVLRPCQVYFPYLDEDLFIFFNSLPPAFVVDKQLHSLTIERAYPAFTSVPYSQFRPACKQGRMVPALYYLQLLISIMRSTTKPPLKRHKILKRSLATTMQGQLPQQAWWQPQLIQLLAELNTELGLKF